MIQFYEHTETGYAMRTWENAKRADLTIAFAIDFDTGRDPYKESKLREISSNRFNQRISRSGAVRPLIPSHENV